MLVVCMKWGDAYSARDVNVLRSMVARNLSQPHEFICFTDNPDGLSPQVKARPLPAKFKSRGMWNKIGLFKPGLLTAGETVLYSDLDVVAVAPLDPLVSDEAIRSCKRFDGSPTGFNSSVICFRPEATHHIYNRFKSEWFVTRRFQNDQDWISHCCPDAPRFPDNLVVSFKRDMRKSCSVPRGAVIVAFHGKPKPHEVDCAFVREHWR